MLTHTVSLKELAPALAKAQAEIVAAEKDKTNPHFKSQYADLASVWNACRESLTKNGLSVVQVPRTDDGKVAVETLLLHSSGEWIRGDLAVNVGSIQPQAVGSAITYLRRYSLSAMTSVAPDDDDDGNAANGERSQQPRQTAAKPSQRNYGTNGHKPAPSQDQHDDGPRFEPDKPARDDSPQEAVSLYSSAKSLIANAATPNKLDVYRQRVKGSTEFTDDEKATLLALADDRADKLKPAHA